MTTFSFLTARPPQWYHFLDAFRAIGSLGVILYHITFFTNWSWDQESSVSHYKDVLEASWLVKLMNTIGFFSVDLFFVISGFLLSFKISDRAIDLSNGRIVVKMILHRMTRLIPGLVIAQGVSALVMGTERCPSVLESTMVFANVVSSPDRYCNIANWSTIVDLQAWILILAVLWFVSNKVEKDYLARNAVFNTLLFLAVCAFFARKQMHADAPAIVPYMTGRDVATPEHAKGLELIAGPLGVDLNSTEFKRRNDPAMVHAQIYFSFIGRYGALVVGAMAGVLLRCERIQRFIADNDGMFVVASVTMVAYDFGSDGILDGSASWFRMRYSHYIHAITLSFLLLVFAATEPTKYPFMFRHSLTQICNFFLSLPIWKPIASTSYLVYLLHMNSSLIPTLYLMPPVMSIETVSPVLWLIKVLQVFLVTFAIAVPLQVLVEMPLIRILKRVVDYI